MMLIKAKATSHVGESAVKARPKRERREVELNTKTAVWGESCQIWETYSNMGHIGTEKLNTKTAVWEEFFEQHRTWDWD